MPDYRQQKHTESDAEYELYRNERRLEVNAYMKAYRNSNPEYDKANNVKRRYSLTPEAYDALISRGCEICGTHEGKLCVDHCHETLKIRGCLCQNCNTSLGHYEKRILPNLDKFTKYLGGTL
jgi:hypothetical protein